MAIGQKMNRKMCRCDVRYTHCGGNFWTSFQVMCRSAMKWNANEHWNPRRDGERHCSFLCYLPVSALMGRRGISFMARACRSCFVTRRSSRRPERNTKVNPSLGSQPALLSIPGKPTLVGVNKLTGSYGVQQGR